MEEGRNGEKEKVLNHGHRNRRSIFLLRGPKDERRWKRDEFVKK